MPAIVAGPGIKPGQVRDDLVGGIHISAASLPAAGIPIPDSMEGSDFLAPANSGFAVSSHRENGFELIRTNPGQSMYPPLINRSIPSSSP